MKRIFLFIATNLAVMLVLSIVLSLLGIGRPGAGGTLQLGSLLAFSLVVGFTGAIFSLLISKPMAKWSTARA
jgi:heat shock protein HtpX